MKWFRSNLRVGARLALGALAIQFLLSFGHFHGDAADAASAPVQVGKTIGLAAASQQASRSVASSPVRSRISFNHEPTGQVDDDCAICAVMALANTMLDAAPPYLLAPQVAAFAFVAVDTGFADLGSAVGAFQPRGPPIA
jgi:hypothetical protein